MQLFKATLASLAFCLSAQALSPPDYVVMSLQHYEKKINEEKYDVRDLISYGKLCLEWNRFDIAKEMLIRAQGAAPEHPGWRAPLAKLYLIDGQPDKVIEITKSRPSLQLIYAAALVQKRQLQQADEIYKKWLVKEPQNASAWAGRVEVALAAGSTTAARKLVSKAAAHNVVPNTRLLLAEAKLRFEQGKTDAAKELLDKILAKQPQHLVARMLMAQCFYEAHDAKGLAGELDVLQSFIPKNPQVVLLSASHAWMIGDDATAGRLLNALGHNKKYLPQVELVRARYYWGKQEFGLAKAALEKYLRTFPKDMRAKRLLAGIAIEAGSGKEVLGTLKELSDSPVDKQLLMSGYLQAGQLDDAIEVANSLSLTQIEQLFKDANIALALDKSADVLGRSLTNQSHGQTAWKALAARLLNATDAKKSEQYMRWLTSEPDLQPWAYYSLGDYYLGNGEMVQAERAYNKAYRSTNSNHAFEKVVGILVAQDKIEEARIMLSQKHNEAPSQFTYLMLADIYQRTKHLDKALELRQAAYKANPCLATRMALARHGISFGGVDLASLSTELAGYHHPLVYELKATIADEEGNHARAISAREAVLAFAEGNSDTQLELARNYLENKQYEGAIHYVDAIDKTKLTNEARIIKAQALVGKKHYDQAVSIYDTVLASEPENSWVFGLKAECLMKQNKLAQATQSLERAWELHKTEDNARYLAKAYMQAKKNDEALNVFKDFLFNHPNNISVRIEYAKLLAKNGEHSLANNQLVGVLEDDNKNVAAMLELSTLALRHSPELALKYARDAEQVVKSDPKVKATLGWALVQDNKAQEGIKYLESALVSARDWPVLHYHLAVALAQLGDVKRAKVYVDKSLELGEFEDREQALALKKRLEAA